MKKLILLFIGILSMPIISAQSISDALRYSNGEIHGTARFRALSGAFNSLGGDISAISLNPAGSAVFTNSYASISLSSSNNDNETSFFNGRNASSNSNVSLQQGGAVFVFKNYRDDSNWKKVTLGIAYDNTKNYEDDWFSSGINTTSVDRYFLNNAQGLRLDEISALPGENTSDAYAGIGSAYGYVNQQAFLGYDSFILEPATFDDDNTIYTSNIAAGNFNQEYNYAATGYNGKIAFNVGAQYTDNLYLGLNLNSHFLNYERSTFLYEENSNAGSTVTQVGFENNLSTIGRGFSFQLGGIYKVSNLRLGFTYDSPTWLSIEEETSQYIETIRTEGGSNVLQIVDPQIINIFPRYRIQAPGKVTASFAYIFGQQGLISFDYSRRDYSNTKFKPTSDSFFASQNAVITNSLRAAATYRVGGEYKIKDFSLRGGYRFEESPYKNGTTIGDLTGYSLGLGYNFGNTRLDLTYDQAQRSSEYQLFNTGLTDATTIDNTNSNITLSLGFRL